MSGDSDALVDDFEKYNFNYDFNDLASNDGSDGGSLGTYENDSHAGDGLQVCTRNFFYHSCRLRIRLTCQDAQHTTESTKIV